MKKLVLAVSAVLLASHLFAQGGLGGFAQLKVVDSRGNPVAGITVELVQNERQVFRSTTGKAGVVQWSKTKVPAGRYICRVYRGRNYKSFGFQVSYKDVGWSIWECKFDG